MTTITERIAKIASADLGPEDHGIFTAHIDLDYGGGAHQGCAGYGFDRHVDHGQPREGTAFGMTFILRLMGAAGVDRWSKVKGRTVIALIEDGMVVGLKPLPTEPGHEFIFRDLVAAMGEA